MPNIRKTEQVPTARRHPLGPQLQITVTAEMITKAIRSHSSHCMISEAVKAAVPYATRVATDISTIRLTDLERGFRYVYLTPRVAQDALVDFDEGLNPKPFSFRLRGAHVSKAGSSYKRQGKPRPSSRKRATAKLPDQATLVDGRKEQKEGVVPRIVGGRRPPQLHIRREFGLRAFRAGCLKRLEADQDPHLTDDESSETASE